MFVGGNRVNPFTRNEEKSVSEMICQCGSTQRVEWTNANLEARVLHVVSVTLGCRGLLYG